MAKERINKRDSRVHRTAYGLTAVLMGIPFMGMGGWFALAGLEVVPLPGKAHAPLWVIAAIGTSFFLAGLMVFGHGLRGMAVRRRRRRLEVLHPDRPWLLDFDWDPAGVRDRAGVRWFNALQSLVLFAVFLAPFHWWAFFSGKGPWMIKAMVVLFDLIPLWLVYQTLYLFAQHLKYGSARLRFARFPFPPGGAVEVVFFPNRFRALNCRLRFVEERFEERGSGENRSTHHVVEQHYELEQTVEVNPARPEVSLSLPLPSDETWVTAMSESPIRYWELDIRAEEPGIDFHASFPLPVYAARTRPRRESAAV
ncbi:MAG: hypothetical protein OER88_02875 [Planctomycetota bacterium]|nr:hypothetical protein [Planctomycetota bacterium]